MAYKKLSGIAGDLQNYDETYFMECQRKIEKNLKSSIETDTKTEKICDILPLAFSQLTVWNREYIISNKETVYETLNNISDEWMMNLIDLKEGKSYILAQNIKVQRNLERLFGRKFENDIMELENVWLRKEIIKKAIEKKGL